MGRTTTVLIMLPLLIACGESGGMRFEAPSEEELRGRIHADPSGVLDVGTLAWALERADEALRFATTFTAFTATYEPIFAEDGALAEALRVTASPESVSADASLASQTKALSYRASGYIDLSCPGADLSLPDFDFGSGKARIESPEVVAVDHMATLAGGALFLLSFLDGCEVGEERLGGRLYGLFESPWVIATDLSLGGSDGRLSADIELASLRFTAVFYDGDGASYRLLITHPEGRVTSARVEGANGLCWLEVAYDPATGAYGLGEALPDCDF